MPRYIDADALIAEYDRVHVGPAGGARKLMVEAPTADVVPRAEVATLSIRCAALETELAALKAGNESLIVSLFTQRAEIAREIFAEIEKYLRLTKTTYIGQRFYALLLGVYIAELKKKYTEERNDNI